MKRATANGGTYWYCPYSKGRLLTLAMAKKFLGEDGAREIWVRSELSHVQSENKCPACANNMKSVSEPSWLGSGEVDVCRRCFMIFVSPGTHTNIPEPEDLLFSEGDSTLLSEVGKASVEVKKQEEKIQSDKEDLIGEGPDGIGQTIFSFLGLPIEKNNRYPQDPWITGILAIVMFFIYWQYTSPDPSMVLNYGYYPNDPLKNGGLNFFISSILHGDWVHLLFNLYFFCLFSDDCEEELGPSKYLLFFIFTAVFVNLGSIFLPFSRDVAHIGISGFVMALMAFYTFRFPTSRLAYLVPVIHSLPFGIGAWAMVKGVRWVRLPIWSVFLFYMASDIFSFYFFESRGSGGTAHSSHIFGALFGILFHFLTKQEKVPLPEFVSRSRNVSNLNEIPQSKNKSAS